jgi:hypothetical protein
MLRLLLLLGIALSPASLVANTIILNGSAFESFAIDGVRYRLRVTGGTNVHNQTGFLNGVASDSTTTSEIHYSGYVIPAGSTLVSATLNFAGAFGSSNVTSAISDQANSFSQSPTFTDTLSGFNVTISSASGTSATVSGQTGSYNLLTLFASDLLNNREITIRWTATGTFARASSPSFVCQGNCNEVFNLSDLRTFSASTSANILALNFDPPPPPPHPTPEPATMVLTGASLLAFGLVLRRRNGRS